MTANFYFWRWADNDLPGRPVDVFAALVRGELHPALQPFDARPLVRELEKIAARDADPAQWELCIVPEDRARKAHHLFLTCPRQLKYREACLIRSKLTCFEEDRAALAWNFPPKRSEFYWGQWPDEPAYDVTLDQLAVLIKRIYPRSPDPFASLTNRQLSFVQCYGHGRRFYVEWRDNYDLADWRQFDHWRAQDRNRLRALDQPYTRGDIPRHRNPDLLTYSDTLRIFQAFFRGEPRPEQYCWMNVNHWPDIRHFECRNKP